MKTTKELGPFSNGGSSFTPHSSYTSLNSRRKDEKGFCEVNTIQTTNQADAMFVKKKDVLPNNVLIGVTILFDTPKLIMERFYTQDFKHRTSFLKCQSI